MIFTPGDKIFNQWVQGLHIPPENEWLEPHPKKVEWFVRTPCKINMEPQNHHFFKGKSSEAINSIHPKNLFLVPYVNFQGVVDSFVWHLFEQ